MSALLYKYGVQVDITFPLIKRGVIDFAVSADYTHSSGDVKVSKDGGAAATATNAPSAITMGNTAYWKLTLTATEMQAAQVVVTVGDAATKAVEDQMIVINTYGNASGQHEFDLDASGITSASTELSAVPAATASLVDQVRWLFALARNKRTQTSSTETVFKDDGSTSLATSATADTGTTFTRAEYS